MAVALEERPGVSKPGRLLRNPLRTHVELLAARLVFAGEPGGESGMTVEAQEMQHQPGRSFVGEDFFDWDFEEPGDLECQR